MRDTGAMSLFGEGLQVVHTIFAPQEVKRLARKFEGNDRVLPLEGRRQRALYAQSAEEAAYFVQRSGLHRRDMRQIVSTYVQREDLERFSQLVTNSHDKSKNGNMQTLKDIDDYIAFRRSHREFFVPNLIGRALDRVNSLIPSPPLTALTPRISR